jgi:hypothetical protein
MWFPSTRFSNKNFINSFFRTPWSRFLVALITCKETMSRSWNDVLPFKCEAMNKIQTPSNPRSVICHRQNCCTAICNCNFQNLVSSKYFTRCHNMRERRERQAQQRIVYRMQFRINLFCHVFSLVIRPNCGMYVGLKINIMSKTKNRNVIFCQNCSVWGWNSKLRPTSKEQSPNSYSFQEKLIYFRIPLIA